MANYKDIHGALIETVSSDPSDPVNGQVWYNSTTQILKGFKSNPAGSWATGGNLTMQRYGMGSAGTQTAALVFGGGKAAPAAGHKTETESYNGTSWTEVADLNTKRNHGAGLGASNTAALMTGGFADNYIDNTETWNGSSWTEVGDANDTKYYHHGAGTTTSAIISGGIAGQVGSDALTGNVETWNGSAWTETTNLTTTRAYHGMFGTATAALGMGGYNDGLSPSIRGECESWNGSSWTEVADLGTASYGFGSSTNGTSTSGLRFGGMPSQSSPIDDTEEWNGTSWSELGNLNSARYYGAGAGNTSAGLYTGGRIRTTAENDQNSTEEFTAPLETTVTFTVS